MQSYIIVIGPFIVALISVWALFYVWKLNARRTASTKFRAALLKAFSGLYPLPTEWPEEWEWSIQPRLESVFSDLQIAVEEFRPFIPWYRRWLFDRAWRSYRYAYKEEGGYQCYHHYMAYSDNPDPKGQFKRNVDKLLSFAKYH